VIYDSSQYKSLIQVINKVDDSYIRSLIEDKLEDFIDYVINKDSD